MELRRRKAFTDAFPILFKLLKFATQSREAVLCKNTFIIHYRTHYKADKLYILRSGGISWLYSKQHKIQSRQAVRTPWLYIYTLENITQIR